MFTPVDEETSRDSRSSRWRDQQRLSGTPRMFFPRRDAETKAAMYGEGKEMFTHNTPEV